MNATNPTLRRKYEDEVVRRHLNDLPLSREDHAWARRVLSARNHGWLPLRKACAHPEGEAG